MYDANLLLEREHYQLNETIVAIVAEKKCYIEAAKKEIQKCRRQIEDFIKNDKFFKITYEPFSCDKKAPKVIKKMCSASEKFNIGPMSTVAGIIAEYAVKTMVSKGARYAIVDNGGDIAIFTDRVVNIGVYTGNNSTSKLAFRILPKNCIQGICTSSGKIGHSFSYGETDAATVFSNNLAIADAAATALGNIINTDVDINNAFRILKNVREVLGAAVFIDDKIGLWGSIPEIIPARVSYDLITKGVRL